MKLFLEALHAVSVQLEICTTGFKWKTLSFSLKKTPNIYAKMWGLKIISFCNFLMLLLHALSNAFTSVKTTVYK